MRVESQNAVHRVSKDARFEFRFTLEADMARLRRG
jgi:hypothetical protein